MFISVKTESVNNLVNHHFFQLLIGLTFHFMSVAWEKQRGC